ncbi:MAG TPA: glyoxalase [Porticoccaceae bacterium]|nr:glyoxalase [Porticoccaceae bacterium]
MESHISTIDAITFVTSDMQDSVAFYQNLGMRVRYGGETAQFTSLSAGNCHVNLVRGDPLENGFWGRVIFFVDDVDATYRQVLAAGYNTETEPADGSWGERYFHVRDPDGNELSFARRLDAGAEQ